MSKKETAYTLAGAYLLLVGLASLVGVSKGLSIYPTIGIDWSVVQPSFLYLFILLLPFYLLQGFFCTILNVIYAYCGAMIDPSAAVAVSNFVVNYLPALICIASGIFFIQKESG